MSVITSCHHGKRTGTAIHLQRVGPSGASSAGGLGVCRGLRYSMVALASAGLVWLLRFWSILGFR